MEAFYEILRIFGDYVWDYIRDYVDCHRKLEEDLNELRSKFQALERRKIDVNSRIQAAVHSGQVVKEEVRGWLENVQQIEDIQDVEERARRISYFQRASLDKLVREKIEVVKIMLERGIFSEGLVTERAPAPGSIIPTENLEGGISTKGRIWEYLMGEKVGTIGVCGIGGVGKTTIMKHVNNDLLRENRFQKVIWVTVSYPFEVFEVQKKIAAAMDVKLREDEEQMRRVAKLMEIMGRVRFVLILDDVWDNFSFNDVGIPEPTPQNGCKVVITSRSAQVCNYLGCKIVKVQPLSVEESLNLFLNKVGHDVLQVAGLEEILKLIVEECAGLPLAIGVIAGGMKGEGEPNIVEWRNALNDLRQRVKSVNDMEEKIFRRLRFSYDRLRNLEIQKCFLYCSLFQEDYEFSREKLITEWIDEGLIHESEKRQDAYDRADVFLNRLEKNCLLEKTVNGYSNEVFKMHDVVRDMAIKSIGPEVGYMIKAGMKLTKVPNEHEWAIALDKVSLMANYISEIPVGFNPKCPSLSTLILAGNRNLSKIPSSFFEDMVGLKVLDLSGTGVEALPDSISHLVNLSALRLGKCLSLKYLPSLAKLRALKKLDLSEAGIEVVPQGMEMLVSLEYLDLYCPNLKEIPTGILPSLSSLQFLAVYLNSGSTKMINLEEVARLSKLESLRCGMEGIQDFNYLVNKLKDFESLTAYDLRLIGKEGIPRYFVGVECEHKVFIAQCEIGEERIVLPHKLEGLWIAGCKNMKTMSVLVRGGVATSSHIFSNLTLLHIWRCSGMKKLFPVELVQALQNLEVIKVRDCEQIEEIIASSDSNDTSSDKFTFPKLRELKLTFLDQLKSICSDKVVMASFPKLKELSLIRFAQLKSICSDKGVMVCDSIEVISIVDCPKLERVPIPVSFPKLRELTLNSLDQLKSICSDKEVMVCDSIEVISIHGCPKLERVPIQGSFPKLRELTLSLLDQLKSICSDEGVMVCDSIEVIDIYGCPKLERVPTQGSFPKLRRLDLKHLDQLKSIGNDKGVMVCDSIEDIGIGGCPKFERVPIQGSFPKLRKLWLSNLDQLKSICSDEGVMVCDSIEDISIYHCPKLERVPIQPPLLDNDQPSPLPCLRKMQEIIASSDSDDTSSTKFTFPKLWTLTLIGLDQLKSICNDKGVMVCDSNAVIDISGCPKLKRIPLQLPLLDNGQPSPLPCLRKMEETIASSDSDESIMVGKSG